LDTGVVRALRRLPPVSEASADFGEFFEHYVFLELRAWIDYRKPRTPLAYWRSRSGYEVDFILDDRIAIEAKATRRVQRKHLRSLRALAEERLVERCIVICREERPRITPPHWAVNCRILAASSCSLRIDWRLTRKARGAIYWTEDGEHISPLELVRRAVDRHPDLFGPALAKLDHLDDGSIVASVGRVPDDWMSPSARAFGIALMRYNRAQLEELV